MKKRIKQDKFMKIAKSIKDELATLRLVPEESFGNVIKRLIEFYRENK